MRCDLRKTPLVTKNPASPRYITNFEIRLDTHNALKGKITF